MNTTSQFALSPGSRTVPARAMASRVPAAVFPGSVYAGNAYTLFGAVGRDGIRRSAGVSGLFPVDPALTYDVRHGYSPARTNRGVSPRSLNPRLRGLTGSNQQIAQTSAAAAYTLLSTLAITDPEPITKALLAIGALVTGLIIKVFSGCGDSCIQATHVVDRVEAEYLKPLLAQWQAMPVKYYSVQQAALKVFDDAWSQILRGCSDPALGDAGRKCISERQRGGTSPWCPNCNWFTLYRDPIANDPSVIPDPDSMMVQTSAIMGGGSSSLTNSGGSISTGITDIGKDLGSSIGGVPVWMIALGVVAILIGSTK